MNILIVCTLFPPDSAIAAVRPYMFAKYLSKAGHQVTVLRSGELFHQPDNSYEDMNQNVRVVSYFGSDSPAERFERGMYVREETEKLKYYKRIPQPIRKVGRFILDPWFAIKRLRSIRKKFIVMKGAIDKLKDKEWDIVFSTYGGLENIWGGQYAAKTLNAKWIQDFRDSVVWFNNLEEYTWNVYARYIQKRTVKNADKCTVISEGLKDRFQTGSRTENIITLYNGYEYTEETDSDSLTIDSDHLTICYLGTMYSERVCALDILLGSIKRLINSGDIEMNRIRFVYGGQDEEEVRKVFNKYKMLDVLNCVGYVDRNTAQRIQAQSDLFLVLSWNTKNSQGILTGKFYEGVKVRRPILAVVAGEVPRSELFRLNEKYHYGFCYDEGMAETQHDSFLEYIKHSYEIKMEKGIIDYEQNAELERVFRYDYLAKKLEDLMESLVEDNGEKK